MDGGGVGVAVPGAADGGGEYDDFGGDPFGRVEPVIAKSVELASGVGDRFALGVGGFWGRGGFEARDRRVAKG